MTDEMSDYGELLAKVKAAVSARAPRVIGIEGFMASGKTHLAKLLATDLGRPHIETDDSAIGLLHPELLPLNNGGKHYIDCLDLGHLRGRIETALDAHASVIVEGICLRDVLLRIEVTLDLAIYVKRLPPPFFRWDDGLHLDDFRKDSLIKGPTRDAFEYHWRVRPHEIADFIYSHKANS